VGDDTSVTIVRVTRIKVDLEQKVTSAVFAMSSHINQDHEAPSDGRWTDNEEGRKELAEVDFRGVSPSEHHVATETLARKLSARQVQMIAIGGTYSIAISKLTYLQGRRSCELRYYRHWTILGNRKESCYRRSCVDAYFIRYRWSHRFHHHAVSW
jgi:hypothetical protein